MTLQAPTSNSKYPPLGNGLAENSVMDKDQIRQILATNVAALMESSLDLKSQLALERRSGVGQSTISRLLSCESGVSIDVVADIARAFHVQPWELLTDTEATREAALQRMLLGPRNPAPVREAAPSRKKGGRNEGNPLQ